MYRFHVVISSDRTEFEVVVGELLSNGGMMLNSFLVPPDSDYDLRYCAFIAVARKVGVNYAEES